MRTRLARNSVLRRAFLAPRHGPVEWDVIITFGFASGEVTLADRGMAGPLGMIDAADFAPYCRDRSPRDKHLPFFSSIPSLITVACKEISCSLA